MCLIFVAVCQGVVIAAEWMCDGKQLVSASWDHVAKLWDAERGECVCTLSGQRH